MTTALLRFSKVAQDQLGMNMQCHYSKEFLTTMKWTLTFSMIDGIALIKNRFTKNECYTIKLSKRNTAGLT